MGSSSQLCPASIHLIMRLSILLLSVLVVLAVLAFAEAKKKKEAGPCKVKDCKKCNLTGKKCKVCNTGFKPKKKGKNGGECSYNKKKKEEKCACPDGYSGDRCQTAEAPADPCSPNPCKNGGSCSGGSCTCAEGFSGDKCQTDACSPNPCKNGGSCSAGSCTCAEGFSGDNCQTEEPKAALALAGPTNLSKCNKVATGVKFEKTFRVTFQIKINSYTGVNIGQAIHITQETPARPGGPPNFHITTMYIFGDSNPYLKRKFQLCMPIKAQQTPCYNGLNTQFPPGEWHTVVVEQVKEGDKYMNRAKVNGVLLYPTAEVVNTDPWAFGEADVYVSDCWTPSFDGAI